MSITKQPWWFWWAGASALGVCIGSVGPWGSVLFMTVSGLKGDGQITLGIGIVALVLFVVYIRATERPRPLWPLAVIALAGLAAGGAGAYDWANLQSAIADAESDDNIFGASISVEWGLVLVTAAGFSLTLAALVTYRHRGDEPPHAVALLSAPAGGPLHRNEQRQEALARLERDYLIGAIPAEDYKRLKAQLLGEADFSSTQEPPGGPNAVPLFPDPPADTPPHPRSADPVTGAPLSSWGRRGVGWLLDELVVAAIWVAAFGWAFTTEDPITGEISDAAVFVIFFAVFLAGPVYQWVMVGRWGQTLGKMAVGVKVRRGEDAGRVGYARALGRAASVFVMGIIFTVVLVVAYLWPLRDRRNQTLYDKMAKTIVVRVT